MIEELEKLSAYLKDFLKTYPANFIPYLPEAKSYTVQLIVEIYRGMCGSREAVEKHIELLKSQIEKQKEAERAEEI